MMNYMLPKRAARVVPHALPTMYKVVPNCLVEIRSSRNMLLLRIHVGILEKGGGVIRSKRTGRLTCKDQIRGFSRNLKR